MRIYVEEMLGDASVTIYNKQGEVIHREEFFGKTISTYVRSIPVAEVEYGHSVALATHPFRYTIR